MDTAARRLSRLPVIDRRGAVGVGMVVLVTVLTAGPWSATARAVGLLANADSLTATHDRLATVAAPGVLANDVVLLGTTAALDADVSHGTLALAPDGGYTYRPDAGFVGTDTFWYHDTGIIPSNSARVTITVTNAAPTAVADTYAATTGVQLVVAGPGVLANDVDADGDALTASLVDGGGSGSLSLSSNGGFTFTSGGSFTGMRTFTYRAFDGIAYSGTTTVSIDVRSPSATPTPTPTPTPIPLPSILPTPTPIPLPSILPTLPPIPLPSILPTARPTATPAPSSGAGSGSPRPSGAPTAAPSSATGSAPGGPPTASAPGGAAVGTTDGPPDGPVASGGGFAIGREGVPEPVGLTGLELAGFGGTIEWAVPALVLTVPGLLLVLAILGQSAAGLLWIPIVRRRLGGFGLPRRRTPLDDQR